MIRLNVAILILSCLMESALTLGTLQSAAARGILLCKGVPYFNAKIKLYDVDLTDFDDLMDETTSDHDGKFFVSGNETEVSKIDPKVNIYHNCEDEKKECLRKIQIILPEDYIFEGGHPAEVFDIGTLNLSGKFSGESRDCIN